MATTYSPVGVTTDNKFPSAVVTPAADAVLKAATALLIRQAIGAASTADIATAIANLVASSPSQLDTLNELAAALGNDANFAATVTAALGLKAPVASPSFTGSVTTPALRITGGTPGVGKVLTADADGVATWQTPAAGGGAGQADTVDSLGGTGSTGREVMKAATAAAARTLLNAATPEQVTAAVAAMVDAAPASLDTLKELATALGNDANFSTTVTNAIAAKYTKPGAGIPPADLTTGVRASLTRADHAVAYVNIRQHGGVGDGTADDTSAMAAVYSAANAAGKPVYLPAGTYRVTALPDFADRTEIIGDGPWSTTILFAGTGVLRTLSNKQFVAFRHLQFYVTAGASVTALRLSGCFRCSFDNVVVRGNYQGDGAATYKNQVGIVLDNNTGATFFANCDVQNLGVGLRTSCIENEMVNSKFTVCYQSLHGVGGTANAGMYLANVEFVGGDGLGSTDVHLLIDGSANSWSLVNVWFEKGDYAARVGVAGSGGPSQFAMFGCKVGARVEGIRINDCRQPHLDSVQFDLDQGGTMTELVINPTYAAEGTAINLVTTLRGDFAFSDFPPYWTVIRRGNLHAGTLDQYAMGNESTSVTNKGYVDFGQVNRGVYDAAHVHTLGTTTRATGLGTAGTPVKFNRAVKVQRFTPHCRTANQSGDLVIQVLKNGSATGMPTLTVPTSSQVAGNPSYGEWLFADGDVLTFNVTAVGTTPGQGLTIEILGIGNG